MHLYIPPPLGAPSCPFSATIPYRDSRVSQTYGRRSRHGSAPHHVPSRPPYLTEIRVFHRRTAGGRGTARHPIMSLLGHHTLPRLTCFADVRPAVATRLGAPSCPFSATIPYRDSRVSQMYCRRSRHGSAPHHVPSRPPYLTETHVFRRCTAGGHDTAWRPTGRAPRRSRRPSPAGCNAASRRTSGRPRRTARCPPSRTSPPASLSPPRRQLRGVVVTTRNVNSTHFPRKGSWTAPGQGSSGLTNDRS